ncbi:MAG: hypothetical protein MI749_17570 [Desulfovibrionales bacterium]|nr:hypothetical protein [Desulfovibrionales bacterium]
MTPDQLVGSTLIVTLESGAFPASSITLQLVSSKDLVWRFDGNLGEQTGSSDYLVSMINNHTLLLTWRTVATNISYIATLDFDADRCFLVRVDKGQNLLAEGVFAIE